MKSRRRRALLLWLGMALSLLVSGASAADPPPWEITITNRYNAQTRQPGRMREFLAANPHLRFRQWTGIALPGGMQASLAMAMAGDVGPDIFETDIRQAVEQGLAHPLAEWIGRDGVLADGRVKRRPDGQPDLNGQVDDDEAIWDGWKEIKPLYRQVVTVDGIPYALPNRGGTYVGILYSYRLLRAAGLDPAKPPRSYDELVYWARKLYDPKRRIHGFQLSPASWAFAPWIGTTGSSIVVQDRTSPRAGKVYTFNEQETRFITPDTGEDLSNIRPIWRANVASKECSAALALYHRLRWQPWMLHPRTGEPVELSGAAIAAGFIHLDGERLPIAPQDIIEGSIGVTPVSGLMETIRRMGREVAMFPLWSGDMTEFESLGVQPEDMGMMPFPGMTRQHRPVLQASNCFFMMGKDVLRRGGGTPEQRKAYRDAVWKMMTIICSIEGNDENVRRKVAAGQARFQNPRDLKRLGFDDYLRESAPEYLAMWDQIERGEILEVVEPFMGKWLQFRDFYEREAIDLVLRPAGRDFDYMAALQRLERDANSGIMFARPESILEQYRPRARIIAALAAGVFLLLLGMIIRQQLRRKASLAGVYKGWMPWLLLLPAVASIAMWSYYPLLRGMVMAFQDYKVVGASPYVGLGNFIGIALDPNFYHYIWTTCRFVLWNLALAFFTPILLAILLTEVPRLKVFFRTLFFLPQMTSALVVTLMWKEMYLAGAQGTINRFLTWLWGLFGQTFAPIDWLGDPRTVMACVILPGVWAGAGIGSLIYLAALKSVPDDLYEAASIDGAGIRRKIWSITLPTIMPLILINFVGAFIATFQTMGNIFLLTFGGPGKETMVVGLAIWQEAYVNLRFSIATSYAWILGGILISFMYLQLRILRRVDFRQAKGDD